MNMSAILAHPAATASRMTPPVRGVMGRFLLPVALSLVFLRTGAIANEQDGVPSDEDITYVRRLVENGLEEVLEDYLAGVENEDAIRGPLLRIEAARARLRSPEATAAMRAALIEDILARRAALIDSRPRHLHAPIWMADQAEDFFDGLFAVEAGGLTALHGYPTPRQRATAQRAAAGMNDSAMRAEEAVGRSLMTIEARPGAREDAEMQSLLRRLVEQERDGRIAWLRGIGAFLHAELNLTVDEERRELRRLAVTTLEPLAARLGGDVAARAGLYAGLARARLGEFDEAAALLEEVAEDPSSLPVDAFAARMGLVDIEQRRSGAAAALAALDAMEQAHVARGDVFRRVLIADRRFLLRKRLAETDASFALADAYRAYLDLLDRAPGASDESMRAIVFARLVNASDAGTPLESLPALVTVARASQLARDEGRSAEAIDMLEQSLRSGRLSDDERPLVLFELARMHSGEGDAMAAAARFIEVARDHPRSSRAEEAISLAATIAERLHREHPADAEVRRTLQEALDVLLASYPNLDDVDQWRYAAGRLALAEQRYDQAISLFRQIAPDSDRRPDGLYMEAAAARQRARAAAGEPDAALSHQKVIDVARDVRPQLHSAAERETDAARSASLRYYLGMVDVFEAEANLGLGRHREALEVLDRLAQGGAIEDDVLAESLRVRIAALQAADRPEDAQGEIERFIAAAPEQVDAVIGPMLASLAGDVEASIDAGRPDDARAQAQRVLAPIAQSLDAWLERQGRPGGESMRRLELAVRIADAYRLAGRIDDALRWYERLLDAQPQGVQVLYGKAECLYERGDEASLAEAMAIYRRLVTMGPGPTTVSLEGEDVSGGGGGSGGGSGGGGGGRMYYWAAQLRMLQILDKTGRNTDKILPRIRQLRQTDRNLGGLRFRREFERLQNRYSS